MTLNEKIKELLRRDPRLRSSDKELFIEIFRLKGLNLTKEQEEMIRDLPAFVSIVRERRRVQSQIKALEAVQSVKIARQIKETEYRSEYSDKQEKFNYQ